MNRFSGIFKTFSSTANVITTLSNALSYPSLQTLLSLNDPTSDQSVAFAEMYRNINRVSAAAGSMGFDWGSELGWITNMDWLREVDWAQAWKSQLYDAQRWAWIVIGQTQ